MVTLIWNELTKHKVHALGTSKIEPRATKGKGKLRKKGRLAPVRQPRPLVMSWHIDMYAKLFGAEVQWWCKHHKDHLHQLREKRRQKGEQLQCGIRKYGWHYIARIEPKLFRISMNPSKRSRAPLLNSFANANGDAALMLIRRASCGLIVSR